MGMFARMVFPRTPVHVVFGNRWSSDPKLHEFVSSAFYLMLFPLVTAYRDRVTGIMFEVLKPLLSILQRSKDIDFC
ncbi:hypothetical protein BDV36DRAFT_19556 [Aspergillus pseudocaelatus]|uniref:Uncharacterized protein n=1 Tax=Aspergillus pseudocaelatus TaxID=1825620 RepID=A0ABQ6WY52_9EURO|nr:hypothetical protein BDV36DRAFT_19556 [Aspergillus pseudocaelatus]